MACPVGHGTMDWRVSWTAGGESALVSLATDRKTVVFAREPLPGATPPDADERRAPSPGSVRPVQRDDARREHRLTLLRRLAFAAWAVAVAYRTMKTGLAFDRELLLVYIATGSMTAGIGRRRQVWMVIRDWLPFALVLLPYELSRGAATPGGDPYPLAVSAGSRPPAVFRCGANGLAAGTPQDAHTTPVGGDHQHGLHVVFHRAVRGCRAALAA